MDMGLDGKVALVTAASKGIGRAIAQELAAEGAKVTISSRSDDALKAAADTIKQATGKDVATYAADLTSDTDVRKLIADVDKDLGGIEILVNSSAGPPTKPFEELSDEDWRNALDVKFLAQMRPSREVFPGMKMRNSGRIINIIGSHGRFPHAYAITAGVVNAALLNLTKALAEEGAPHNILVNAINPGLTDTERVTYLANIKAENQGITYDEAVAEMTQDQLLHRLAEPAEIASMAVLLASSRGGFITGSMIDVDGGFTPTI
jgi:3-oxoacyl-[acyl-carrier protein] reductase